MHPNVPTVALTEVDGRPMLAVKEGYDIRDEIKEAGGRFHSDTKAWLLTEDSPKALAQVAAAIRRMGGDPTLLDFIVRGGSFADAKAFASPVTGEAEQVFVRPRNTGHLESEPADDLFDFPLPLFPYQRVGARFARSRQGSLIADEMGLGKAQPLDALVLTPTGWTCMSDISVCDEVIGSDGKATEVLGVFPQGERPIYRVTFSDGASVECDAEHLWQVSTSSYISQGRPWRVMTTTELASDLRHPSGKRKWRIPVLSAPVEYDSITLPLDAYVLGALIGDGSLKQGTYFSSGDQYIVDEMQRLLPHGHFVKKLSSRYDYSITANSPFITGANAVRNALRDLGLLGTGSEDKFIPENYLRAPVADRISLLQGLLDTDGHACTDKSRVEFSTASERLARDFIDLVEGLGGTTRYGVTQTTHRPSHRVAVILPNDIPPFRLPRKAEAVRPRVKNLPSRVISSIEYVGDRPTQCIAVAASDHLYVTNRHVVTHNTRQALAAASLDSRVLVICPAVTKTHWRNEAADGLACEPLVLHGTKAQFIDPATRVVVVNYDILAKHIPMLTAWRPTTVILDEAHMVKNPKSQRTKALMGFVKAVKPRVIALTGTPIMNRPVELIPILQMTGAFETVGKNWINYVKTFCAAKQTQWGWDTSGASNLDVLAQRLHDTIMIRRTKAEVLTELPSKSRRVIELDLEASLAEYKAAEKAATEAFEGRVADIMKAKGISAAKAIREATKEPEGAAQIAELRLQVGLAKMDAAAGIILEHLESTGRKAVVFAHHHEVRAGLRQRFADAGFRVVEIGGETSQKHRDEAITAFQTDPSVKVFLGSTAASVGVTLTAASDVFLVEQQWTPATLDQSEDRCVAEGTVVLTERGPVPVEQVVVGDRVVSHLDNWDDVTDVWSKELRGPLTTVEYVGGGVDPLRVTHDHEVWTQRGWVQAHHLLPGDLLYTPRPAWGAGIMSLKICHSDPVAKWKACSVCGSSAVVARGMCNTHYLQAKRSAVGRGGVARNWPRERVAPNGRRRHIANPLPMTDDLCFVIGHYLAEGFASTAIGKGRFVSHSAHEDERPILEWIRSIYESLGVSATISANGSTRAIELRAYSLELAHLFHDLFGGGAHGKRLPEGWLSGLSERQSRIILDAYLGGDGYARNNQQEWVTASQSLAYSISHLAEKCGFRSLLRRGSAASGAHYVGGYTNGQSDGWRKVRTVSTDYVRGVRVYDITTKNDHSFQAGLVAVHNCHRIGQEAESVTAWHLIAPACAVDKHMWKTVERKRSITAHALGDEDAPKAERHGGRGVAGYVASLLSQSKKKAKIVVSEDDLDADDTTSED